MKNLLKNLLLFSAVLFIGIGCSSSSSELPNVVEDDEGNCEPKWFDSNYKKTSYGGDYYAYGTYNHPLRRQARGMAEQSARASLSAILKTSVIDQFKEVVDDLSEFVDDEEQRELVKKFETDFGALVENEAKGMIVSQFSDCNEGQWFAYAEIKFNLEKWSKDDWSSIYEDAVESLNMSQDKKEMLQQRSSDISDSLRGN